MNTNAEFEIRQLTRADISAFKQLITVFNMVFEEDESAIGSESYLEKLLGSHNFIAMAAFAENEVVGGLTAHELPLYYSDTSEIFVYDVAVKREFQRLGIGKRLLHGLREYCREHGINEFFVFAHEEDEQAVEFYHYTGGKSERVINFIYEASVPNG